MMTICLHPFYTVKSLDAWFQNLWITYQVQIRFQSPASVQMLAWSPQSTVPQLQIVCFSFSKFLLLRAYFGCLRHTALCHRPFFCYPTLQLCLFTISTLSVFPVPQPSPLFYWTDHHRPRFLALILQWHHVHFVMLPWHCHRYLLLDWTRAYGNVRK